MGFNSVFKGLILTGDNKELGKQVPVPHSPPKIWKGLARDGTQ